MRNLKKMTLLASSWAFAALIAALGPGPAAAQLWRSSLLERIPVRVDMPAPGGGDPRKSLRWELKAALGADAVTYESFTVAYLPASGLKRLSELAHRGRLPTRLGAEPVAHLPARRLPLDQLERRAVPRRRPWRVSSS